MGGGMSATDQSVEERDVLRSLGGSWGILLFIGVVTTLIGLFLAFYTDKSIAILALFFGIYLLFAGIFQIVQSFSQDQHRALLAISGILSVILAIYLFKAVKADYSAEILALFIGISWLFRGIVELIVGLQSKGEDGRGWLIMGGVLLLIGAVVIFVWPNAAVSLIVTISGIVLIVVGISEIVGAFQIKKLVDV
jgi:uncharacterized membrane protein HdeD (DUF308 family)